MAASAKLVAQAFSWNKPQGGIPNAPNMAIGPPPPYFGTAGLNNGSIVDLVPVDLLYLVDPYWNQFPPMNPLMNTLLGLAMTIMGFIAVAGNFVVLYVFLTTKSLRTPSNLLIVNLAFSDFLMMGMMFPFMAVSCFMEMWAFGPLLCELHAWVGCFCGPMSIWSMTTISIDRYNVIVHGVGAKPLTYKKVLGIITAIDVIALIWSILPLVGWSRYALEGNMSCCGADYMSTSWVSRSFIITTASVHYFTPLSIIIFCYFNIVKAVCEHEEQMREQARKMNVQSLRSSEASKTRTEVRLAKVAMMMISLWVMAWTPYLVINFRALINRDTVNPLNTIWGSTFSKFAACYNPIVYGVSHPRYRTALYDKFPCLACTADPPEDDAKSTATAEMSHSDAADVASPQVAETAA